MNDVKIIRIQLHNFIFFYIIFNVHCLKFIIILNLTLLYLNEQIEPLSWEETRDQQWDFMGCWWTETKIMECGDGLRKLLVNFLFYFFLIILHTLGLLFFQIQVSYHSLHFCVIHDSFQNSCFTLLTLHNFRLSEE